MKLGKSVRPCAWSLAACAFVLAPLSRAEPVVYGESAMVKVKPEAPARTGEPVQLIAARNEFVSFQVVIHGNDSGARSVSASFDGLTGPGRIGGTDVTLYREAFLTITKPHTASGKPELWPDPLVPDVDEISGERRGAFPLDVPPGEARAVWVDVHVPLDAPPGEYQGAVKVSGAGIEASVPVALTVVDATLPSTPSLATAFLIHPPTVCQAHTGSRDCGGTDQMVRLLEGYQRMALEHRFTLTNFFVLSPENGDWTAFDAAYAPFLDGTAPTRLPGAKMTTAQYVGPREPSRYAEFAAHFRERGWLDRAFDYTGDEPPHGISFAEAARRARLIRQAAPDLRTLLTTTVDELRGRDLEDLFDIVTPVVNFIEGAQRPSSPRKALWLYQSCMSQGCDYGTNAPENRPNQGWPSYMVDRSAAKNRAMQWVLFTQGASGELYYETALALPTAWNDIFRFNGNGDGTLFYPGTPAAIGGATHVPVSSIRLKLLRLGVQDHEWLKKVSEAGDPTFAHEVARSVVPSAHGASDDGEAMERARPGLRVRSPRRAGDPERGGARHRRQRVPRRAVILAPARWAKCGDRSPGCAGHGSGR